MAVSRRTVLSAVVLVLLGVFVAIGFWYQSRQVAPSEADDTAAIVVTNGADRGAGSLREALFIAAAAKGPSTISVRAPKVTLATALPPIVNSQGVRLIAAQTNAEIDAAALPGGPVLDVASANVSIEGFRIATAKPQPFCCAHRSSASNPRPSSPATSEWTWPRMRARCCWSAIAS